MINTHISKKILILYQIEACDMSSNNFKYSGEAIGKLLVKMPRLKTLGLHSCGLFWKDLAGVGQAIGDQTFKVAFEQTPTCSYNLENVYRIPISTNYDIVV